MRSITILLMLVITSSCKEEMTNLTDSEMWRVTKYLAGFQSVLSFGTDDIVWTFDYEANKLTVVNNVSGMYPGTIPSGNYDFTFENNVLSFEHNNLAYTSDFTLSENNSVLTLFFDLIPQAVDDEVSYVFERK